MQKTKENSLEFLHHNVHYLHNIKYVLSEECHAASTINITHNMQNVIYKTANCVQQNTRINLSLAQYSSNANDMLPQHINIP